MIAGMVQLAGAVRGRRRCRWRGSHCGDVAAGVEVRWPCGHADGHTTPTCAAHLEHLLAQGGRAREVVACPVCGVPGSARVSGTHDL